MVYDGQGLEGVLEGDGPDDMGDDVTDYHGWDFLICFNRISPYEDNIVLKLHLH